MRFAHRWCGHWKFDLILIVSRKPLTFPMDKWVFFDSQTIIVCLWILGEEKKINP